MQNPRESDRRRSEVDDPEATLRIEGEGCTSGGGPTGITGGRAGPPHARQVAGSGPDATGGGRRLGPYLLQSELGRGGQGVVYRALDTRLGRPVALKLITERGPMAEEHIARFRREAEAASRLDHPGICAVYDAGVVDAVPYIAMRFVNGETLASRIARLRERTRPDPSAWKQDFPSGGVPGPGDDQPPSPAEDPARSASSLDRRGISLMLALFEKAAIALHAAHEAGVLHRDIKPANIMIAEGEQPVLLDFGLAHVEDSQASVLTQTGDVFGTPAYMPPEQVSGLKSRLDRRSDVYSLGVSLYESLVQRRPFEAATRQVLYQAILREEPQDPRRFNPSISRDLKVVLETALAKERDGRYQTALDLAHDLAALREGRPIAARPVGLAGRMWRWSKRHPSAAALALTAALGAPLVAGLAGFIWASLPSLERQRQADAFETVEDLLERGYFEQHHGSTETAVKHFESALDVDPGSAEAFAGLVLSHMILRNYQGAMDVLETAERRIEDPLVLAPLKGEVLRNLGMEEEYEAHRKLAPQTEGPLFWFVEAMRAMSNGHLHGEESLMGRAAFTRAEHLMARAIAASPRARRAYHFQLAHVQGHRPSTQRREEVAEAIASLWPDSGSGRFWVGFSLSQASSERAIEAYKSAIALSPDHAAARANLARLLAQSGDPDGAIQNYREAIRLRPTFLEPYLALSEILRTAGRLEESEDACKAAMQHHPASSKPLLSLGNTLMAAGRPEAALEFFERGLAADPGSAALHYSVGRAHYDLGRVDRALVSSEEALRLDSQLSVAHRVRALCLKAKGMDGEAEAALRTAIRTDPGHVSAYNDLGLLLSKRGDFDEAIAAYRRALELDPKSTSARLNLGKAIESTGNHEDAIACYRECIQLRPQMPVAHERLADALFAAGRADEALDAYRQSIELSPESARIRNSYAMALERSGELDKAIEQYARACRIEPSNPLFRCNLGIGLARAGKKEQAADSFREAIRLDPGFGDAHHCLGCMLLELGELDGSLESFKKATRLDPENTMYRNGFEATLKKRGEPWDLAALYRARLARDGRDAGSLNGLAWVLVDPEGDPALRNPAEALPLAEQAASLTGRRDANILDTLATTLFANGRLADAVSVQEELVRLLGGKDAGPLKLPQAQAALDKYRAALSREGHK